MDYHQDRFEDFSLMVFKKDKLKAIFPANKTKDAVCSHQGLTYGGLVLLENEKFDEVSQMFDLVIEYLRE
ncbi:MAG TPA: hypothetical protein VKZ98_09005, partial [Aquaticitalea sp.]|nr:hypothetical protein [Aquaticitalea sp.]